MYFFEKKNIQSVVLLLTLTILTVIIGRNFIATLVEYVPLLGQTAHSINEYSVLSYTDKYFILVRPLILFSSLFFLTSFKIKTIFLYFFIVFFLYDFFFKLIKKNYHENFRLKKDLLYFIGSLTFVTGISIVFPVLSFAKYYIFIFPFFLKIFLHFYTVKKIRYFLMTSNFIVIMHFFTYYTF